MSALAIARALFEAVPLLKKLVEHPLKGKDMAQKVLAWLTANGGRALRI